MENGFFILFGICFLLHISRTVYSILKYQNKINSKNKFLYTIIFIVMILLWVTWFQMCEFDTNKIQVPIYIKFFGFFLFILGIISFILSLIQLRGVENIDHLETRGIFSKFRHPMYFGMILWIIGYPLFQQSKYALITSVLWIINILIWRSLEEKELMKKYDGYKIYKEKTLF